ncbi:MAG: 50S ribosomal protein L11 methyltransferase [Candidatus Zixiibacteriota bacterium]
MAEIKPDAYVEVRLDIPRVMADAVCNFIIDHIATGIILEEEDDADITGIVFYVPNDNQLDYRALLSNYFSAINATLKETPRIRERLIKNINWIEQYKALIGPVRIGEDIVIRPTWNEPVADVKYEIVLEPKMAFGTGSHETTRSCLKLINDNFLPGRRFLDLGTGSGILSILADKMKAAYIKAVDYDPIAVENCRENFELNEVTAPNDILLGTIDRCDGDPPYDFVCANIIKSTILPILPRLFELTAAGGKLVLSGLLDKDESDIEATLKELGQTDFSVLRDNEWSSYLITRR